ncbi:MAG: methylated-DNA-protein-cysteine methyltransferase-like protein [Bacteroidia bacterium]|jgi:methylated-DNA-protein-cysteine methyltransferase-like protein
MPKDKRLHGDDKSNSFFELVYQVVELIPHGSVTSYGAIAKYLGTAKSSRMVGWALNALNNTQHQIPAHRVVNKQGLLTGKAHFRGIPMEQLLSDEGVVIVENQIQQLATVYWDPNIALDLG